MLFCSRVATVDAATAEAALAAALATCPKGGGTFWLGQSEANCSKLTSTSYVASPGGCQCSGLDSSAKWKDDCSGCEDCFPAGSKVTLADMSEVDISELGNGFGVLAPRISEWTVENATHIFEQHQFDFGFKEKVIDYYEVQHSLMRRPLLISGGHILMSQTGCQGMVSPCVAASIRVGDCVQALARDGSGVFPSSVVAVSRTMRPGMYSPLTTTGTLFVDGVAVSSYTSDSSDVDWSGQHAAKKTHRALHTVGLAGWLDQHATSPILCKVIDLMRPIWLWWTKPKLTLRTSAMDEDALI